MIHVAACRRKGRAWPALALLWATVLFTGGCAFSAARASFSSTNFDASYSTSHLDALSSEDGLLLKSTLTTSGLKGRSIDVAAYHGSTFLGVARVIATDAPNQPFSLFMPASKLYNAQPFGAEGYDLTLYATSPRDRNHYLGARTWEFNQFKGYPIRWDVENVQENATLDDGQRGIRILVNLSLHGLAGHAFICSLHVTDGSGADFTADQGGPINFDVYTLKPPFEESEWDDLVLAVPYSKLSGLLPWQAITITPVLTENGAAQLVTIHITTLAGGDPETVKAQVQKQISDQQTRIRSLQDQIGHLQSEAK